MYNIKSVFLGLLFLVSININASETIVETKATHAELEKQATDYFHTYINTYNKRFGHPENKDSFITELSSLLTPSFMMVPPTSAPTVVDNKDLTDRIFNGFVGQLETKGATKLHWKNISLRVLSPKKILANNSAYATNNKGEVVYETVSVYLLYLDNKQWKIALFNPYLLENTFTF